MRKIIIISRLIIPLFVIGILSSCTQKPSQLAKIPGNAGLVFAMDGKSMHHKGKFDQVKDLNMYTLIEKEIKLENPKFSEMFQRIIDDSKTTGIDMKSDMFFFVVQENDDKEYFGMVFKMIDESKFKDFMKGFMESVQEECVIQEKEGYKFISPESDAYFAWDGKTLIVLGTEDFSTRKYLGDYVDDIFTMKPDESINSNKDFKNFYKNRADLDFWFSYNMMLEMGPAKEMQGMFILDFEGIYLHAHTTFEKDEILVKGKMSPKELVQEKFGEYDFIKDNVDSKILDYLPEQSYMAFSMALVPSEYFKFLQSFVPMLGMLKGVESELGFSFDDLLESFDGDFAFSMNELELVEVEDKYAIYEEIKSYAEEATRGEQVIEMETTLIPQFIFVGSINSEETLQKLFGFIGDNAPKNEFKKEGDIYIFDADDINIYVGWNEEVIVMTDNLELCQSSLNKELENTMKGSDLGNKITGNSSFFFADLDMNNYPEDVREWIEEEMDTEDFMIFEDVMGKFRNIMMKSSGDNYEFEMKVRTIEDRENSLYTIIKMIDELVPMMN